jgi:hypothetical protein
VTPTTIAAALALAASPASLTSPLLASLSIWTEKPGTYVEYQVRPSGAEPGSVVRLAVMEYAAGPVTARWVRMTVTVSLERVEVWALAERGPDGLPVRRRTLLRIGGQVAEAPGGADHEPDARAPPKPEWKGVETVRTPAGEFKARVALVRVEGAELKIWLAPKIPLGSRNGGVVRMEAPGGPIWELAGYGVDPVAAPPRPTPAAAAPPAAKGAPDAAVPVR